MSSGILVTGASGFVGWNIVRMLKHSGLAYKACYKDHKPFHIDDNWGWADVCDYAYMKELISHLKPTAVIHAAAIANTASCAEYPVHSAKVNVQSVRNIAGICADHGVPMVLTSTDLVFDGKKGFYTEEDAVNPLSHYGEQKVYAEQVIAEYEMHSCVRLSLVYGPAGPHSGGYLQEFKQKVAQGDHIPLFTDEHRTPIHVYDVAAGVITLLEQEATGLYHLGGPERMNRYELGQQFAEKLNTPHAKLLPVRQVDINLAVERPKDVSLVSLKLKSIGFEARALSEIM